jgi:hypothetical protein
VTHEKDDDRIRDDFLELRAHVERPEAIPDFETMMARAHAEVGARPALAVVDGGASGSRSERDARRQLTRIGGWMSLAAAAAAAGLLLVEPPSADADAEFQSLVIAFAADGAAGAWRSPTSSLLSLPGLDLGSVPSVGELMPRGDAIRSADGTGTEGRDS